MNLKDAKMNLWNIKNLPLPPINTYKTEDTKIGIEYVTKIFREGVEFFDKEHHLNAEYKVMSILIYRLKQKFRSAKDFKAFEKLYKSLNNYFNTNILKDLRNFVKLIPPRYTKETYLPNKNMLDYILVRLQGIVKLLDRIQETCKITAELFYQRIQMGHYWNIGFIIFSLTSRVYILAKYIAKFICRFYNKIFPFTKQLRVSGRSWLPENYVLPTDLKIWLNADWLDVDDEVQITEISERPNITQFFDLVADDDDDIQFCDEYIMIDDDDVDLVNEFNKLEDIKESIQRIRGFDMDEDIGQIIEIDDSLLVDGNSVLERNNESKIPRTGISENVSQTEQEENNEPDFGEVIEANNTKKSESEGNELIILDDSLSFKGNSNKLNEVIDLGDRFQAINRVRIVPDNDEIISILDNSCELDSSVRHTLKKHTESINSDNEVVIIPDSPVVNKRNSKKEKGVERKKKNLRAGNANTPKKLLTKKNKNGTKETLSKKKKLENGYNLSNSSGKTVPLTSTNKRKSIKKTVTELPGSSNTRELNGTSKSHLLFSPPVIDLCDNKKKNERKRNMFNSNTDLSNVEGLGNINKTTFNPNKKRKFGNTFENFYLSNVGDDLSNAEELNKKNKIGFTPNKRMKLGDFNESSRKKAKKSKNLIIEESARINQKKPLKNVHFNKQKLEGNNISGVKRDRNKFKKHKEKVLKNSVRIVQQTKSLKHRTNKKQYRYFKNHFQ